MRARDIIGRTVMKVDQDRTKDNCGTTVYAVKRLYLDNGVVLYVRAEETEMSPIVEIGKCDWKWR